MTRKQLLIIAGGVIAIIIIIFLCSITGICGKPPRPKPAHLEIWGVYDEPEIFQELLTDYKNQNKHISIEYKKFPFSDYEKQLVDAFAADRGPDIWMIHNTWLPRHKDKIKEIPIEIFSLGIFRDSFVDVAEKDLVDDSKIYGLPLYVDTLALYYNKDLLNSAGISSPPETWGELIDDLDKLVKRNKWGGIEKAGAALGTAENINRSTDILSLLMLQNGTEMVSESKKSATFNKSILLEGGAYYPGKDALRFYTDFSNPGKRTYTWNRQMPYSIDAFVEGRVAIMFNYSHHIPVIKAKAPYLSFSTSPMPQIEGRDFDINYANYWALAVSKKTKAVEEAWKFIVWLTNQENAKKYLEKARKPTARRDLVDWQKDDLELGVFAKQSLTARSWYQIDSSAIENIFAETIKSVILGTATVDKAIDIAVNQVTLLMQ